MPKYDQVLADKIIAGLDGKQLRNISPQMKADYAQKVAINVRRIQSHAEEFPALNEHMKASKELTVQAIKALEDHINFFSQKPQTSAIAISNALVFTEKDGAALNEAKETLERINTRIDDKKKPGQDNTKAFLIAKAVVRVYAETFNLEPTHSRSFQTYAYDPKSWGEKSEKGNLPPFDKTILIISQHIGISFSESILREALSLRKEALVCAEEKGE